jgi:hypothetical protein
VALAQPGTLQRKSGNTSMSSSNGSATTVVVRLIWPDFSGNTTRTKIYNGL